MGGKSSFQLVSTLKYRSCAMMLNLFQSKRKKTTIATSSTYVGYSPEVPTETAVAVANVHAAGGKRLLTSTICAKSSEPRRWRGRLGETDSSEP